MHKIFAVFDINERMDGVAKNGGLLEYLKSISEARDVFSKSYLPNIAGQSNLPNE